MKPKIIKSEKNLIQVEFNKIDRGFMTLVKEQLWKDKSVELAGFKVTHPEKGKLIFTLKTKSKKAKEVWNNALKEQKKTITGLKKQIPKLK